MMRINWNEPKLDEKDLEEIKKVVESSYVNEGPKTKELEDELKKYLEVNNVILTTNATAALFLAIKADSIIKKVENFEVIVPDLTMFATAAAVEWAGGKPVLVDVERERGTIDVGKIEEKITDKTIAVVPVHILGRATNMGALAEITNKYGLSIMEDSAGALGSKHNGKFSGTFGKVGCFSLQSNKIITSGQGGIIVTNDDTYFETIRRLRDFGRFSNKELLHQKIGYNLKFNDLSAALALAQFRKIEDRKKLLWDQFNQYKKRLNGLNKVKFFEFEDEEIPLWADVIVNDRLNLVDFLKSQGIYPRECWPALHMNPPYKYQGNDDDFPNSYYLSENILWLPNGPAISEEQIDLICRRVKEFYRFKK